MGKTPLPRHTKRTASPTPRKIPRLPVKGDCGEKAASRVAGSAMNPDHGKTPYSRMLRTKIQQVELLRQPPQPDFDRWLDVTAPLLELLSLDNQLTHHPIDAIDAVIKSERAKVPPPPWASDIFKNILHKWMFEVEGFDLNKEFGVKPGGRGLTPEGLARQLALRDDLLATNVLKLVHLGKPVLAACRAVALWFLDHPWWSNIAFQVRPYRRHEDRGKQDRVEQFAKTVKKLYYRYRKTHHVNDTEALVDLENPEFRAEHIATLPREGLLEQFPDLPWADK